MYLPAIDTSSFQRHAWDRQALQRAGIQLVIIRATEGTHLVDADHDWAVGEARAAGCVVCHYHVAEYTDPMAEAVYFTSHAAARPGDLVMVDHEAGYITAHPAAWSSHWVLTFTDRVKGITGARGLVQYTSNYPIEGGWLESVRTHEPLMLAWPGADPNHPPAPARPWLVSLLQFGTRPSTAGPTDADSAYFSDRAQLRRLGIPTAPRGTYTADGTRSLHQLAHDVGVPIHDLLWETAQPDHRPHGYGSTEAAYIDGGDWAAAMPRGMVVFIP